MGDRNQNINIKYNIDTSGVERAASISVRAQAATDNLRSSVDNVSKSYASTGRQAVSSIEAMEQKLARLKTQISVTSSSDTKRLTELSSQYKALNKQLDDQKKKYLEVSEAQKKTAVSTQSMAKNMGNLVSAVKLFLTAGIVKETVDMAISMAKLAGNVEGVEKAFSRIPGSTLILEDLKRATHGTVTDLELMQRALKAQNFGISLNSLGNLLEFAAIRAQQTGQNVDYFVNSIVDGIGRKSLRVLDNLQISQSRIKEQLHGISIESASVAQVSEAMGRIAGEEINKMGGFAETSATSVSKLEVAFQELKISISKFLDTTGFIGFLTQVTQGLKELVKARFDLDKVRQNGIENQIDQQAKLNALTVKGEAETLSTQKEKIDLVNETIQRLLKQREVTEANIESTRKQIEQNKAVRVSPFGTSSALDEKKAAQDRLNNLELEANVRRKTISLLFQYLSSLENVTQASENELGIIESLEARIQSLNTQLEKSTSVGEAKRIQGQLEVTKEVLDRFKGAISDLPPTVDLAAKKQKDFTKELYDTATGAEGATQRMMELVKTLDTISTPVTQIRPLDFVDQLELAVKDSKDILKSAGIDIFQEQIVATAQLQVVELQNQLQSLREFYDTQQILAGDNERAKAQLRLKEEKETNALRARIAKKDKDARIFSVIVDTAAGIARAFATAITPAQAIVQAALVAASGASQLAIINRTPLPKFAKGVIDLKGPGTTTSDSIPAMLSKRESVMTGEETKRAKGIFQAVRAKKLDDRVLKDLKLTQSGVKYVGMTDDRIVKELQSIRDSQPDIIRQGSIVYEVRSKGETYKQIVRSKSMGL